MKRFHITWKGFGVDPAFDWYLCLSCFALALVIVIFIDAFLFLDLTKTGSPQEGSAQAPTAVLDRASLDSIAEAARARDAVPRIVPQSVLRDPSL